MSIEDLPYFIEETFYDDDDPSDFEKKKCFLTVNRDVEGSWSCGYVTWDGDGREMAIPQLVTNNSSSLEEAAIRMAAKLERFNKNV